MTSYCSVNDALERLDELLRFPLEVEGILEAANPLESGYELLHYPAAERAGGASKDPAHRSSIWLHFGAGSIQPNHGVLAKWIGKRVRVHGVVNGPPAFTALSDPLGAWPAHIEVYSVQRTTSQQRRSVESDG